MAKRIQLRRTRGWRLPAGTVNVARPGPFGNPFRVGDPHPEYGWPMSASEAVWMYEWWLGTTTVGERMCERIRAELQGRDVACWCKTADSCHGDVILQVANENEVT